MQLQWARRLRLRRLDCPCIVIKTCSLLFFVLSPEFCKDILKEKSRYGLCPDNNLYLSLCLRNFNFDSCACKADDLCEVSRSGFNMAVFMVGQHFVRKPVLRGQHWEAVVVTIRERHQSSVTKKKHRKDKILSSCRHFHICFLILNYGFSIKEH